MCNKKIIHQLVLLIQFAINLILSQTSWEAVKEGAKNQVIFKNKSGDVNKLLEFKNSYIDRNDPIRDPLVLRDNNINQIYFSKQNASLFVVTTQIEKLIKPDQNVTGAEWFQYFQCYLTVYDANGEKVWEDNDPKLSEEHYQYWDVNVSDNDSIIVAYAGLEYDSGAKLKIYDANGKKLNEIDGNKLGYKFLAIDRLKISSNGHFIGFQALASGGNRAIERFFVYSVKDGMIFQPIEQYKPNSFLSINNRGEANVKIAGEYKSFRIY